MWQRPTQRIIGIALVWCGLGIDAATQMVVTTGRDTLRGLPGVEVVVEDLPPDLAQRGLAAAAIRGDVVERLRANGIAVYASHDENPSLAKPYVYVHVNALELPGDGGYAVGIQVHLRQTLRSPVTESNVVDAMTWEKHNVVVVPARELPALRPEILEFIDLFVEDWRAVHR